MFKLLSFFVGQESLFALLFRPLHRFYWLVWDLGQETRANAPSPTSNRCQEPLNVMGWWGGGRLQGAGRAGRRSEEELGELLSVVGRAVRF